MDMSSMGHQKVIDSLKSENEMLKNALLSIQENLRVPVNDSIDKVAQLQKVETNHKGMSN